MLIDRDVAQSVLHLVFSLVEAHKITLMISMLMYSIRDFCLKSRIVPDCDSTVFGSPCMFLITLL